VEDQEKLIDYLELNRGLYIEGNRWCYDHRDTDLFTYFHTAFVDTGEANEITRLDAGEDCRFGAWSFGYYANEEMPMAANSADRVRAQEGAETIMTCNQDFQRSVYYDGNEAYRTYSQSVSFLGISNAHDFDRALLLRDILVSLAGYQGRMFGRAVDNETDEAISGASIEVIDCGLSAVTDIEGRFEIGRIPTEQFNASISADGYEGIESAEIDFDGNQELEVEFRLNQAEWVVEEDAVPGDFGLISLYPNPFNPETTVSFSVQHRTDVRLEVFDLSGNSIFKYLLNDLEPGMHSLPVNLGFCPAGNYLFRLSGSGETTAIRGILLK
jgi:hypothetical protein